LVIYTVILFGVILLIGLVDVLIPKTAYAKIFTSNMFMNSIIGAGLGSILAGNPITSYILGGELLTQGISLMAITAFIAVKWLLGYIKKNSFEGFGYYRIGIGIVLVVLISVGIMK